MFAKTIVLSDAFLDMPLSARCLYFTLGMFADDDGFVNGPKSIMRQCGASSDDLKVLASKRFILPFDSGIIVIKHWRINNYLRNDRYVPTKYADEKSRLVIEENGAYSDAGIPSSGIPSIGKDSIGKVSIGKDRLDNEGSTADKPPEAEPQKTPYDEITNLYLSICFSYPKIQSLSANRKKAVHARWIQYHDLETFKRLFEKAEASDFLKGKNNRNWSATFDWLLNDANMAKTLEGNYDNKAGSPQSGTGNVFADRLKEMQLDE